MILEGMPDTSPRLFNPMSRKLVITGAHINITLSVIAQVITCIIFLFPPISFRIFKLFGANFDDNTSALDVTKSLIWPMVLFIFLIFYFLMPLIFSTTLLVSKRLPGIAQLIIGICSIVLGFAIIGGTFIIIGAKQKIKVEKYKEEEALPSTTQ